MRFDARGSLEQESLPIFSDEESFLCALTREAPWNRRKTR